MLVSIEKPNSNAGLLDLLRIAGSLTLAEMAYATEVTPTAVRQRLMRLMQKGSIWREVVRHGRGRPRHLYRLVNGSDPLREDLFDMAIQWQESLRLNDSDQRRVMLLEIGRTLSSGN